MMLVTSEQYSDGARLSGRTRYWCNRSVITRNLAVSDMYRSVFGKDAPDSLYVLLCRYIQSQPLTGTSADQLPHRKSRPLATA